MGSARWPEANNPEKTVQEGKRSLESVQDRSDRMIMEEMCGGEKRVQEWKVHMMTGKIWDGLICDGDDEDENRFIPAIVYIWVE